MSIGSDWDRDVSQERVVSEGRASKGVDVHLCLYAFDRVCQAAKQGGW